MTGRRFIHLIIFAASAAACVASRPWSAGRQNGFGKLGFDDAEVLVVESPTYQPSEVRIPVYAGTEDFSLYLRLANLTSNPDKRYQWTDAEGNVNKSRMPGFSLSIGGKTLHFNPIVFSSYDGSEIYTLNVSLKGEKIGAIGEGLRYGADNALLISRSGNIIEVKAGYAKFGGKITLEIPTEMPVEDVVFSVDPGGRYEISRIDCESGSFTENTADVLFCDDVDLGIQLSKDSHAGLWRVAGRTFDENILRLGGKYTVALTSDDDGSLYLWYVSGAEINPQTWRDGMLKAKLVPDVPGVYAVTWYDAQNLAMTRDITAWFDNYSGDLVFNFPLFNSSTLTFRRLQ